MRTLRAACVISWAFVAAAMCGCGPTYSFDVPPSGYLEVALLDDGSLIGWASDARAIPVPDGRYVSVRSQEYICSGWLEVDAIGGGLGVSRWFLKHRWTGFSAEEGEYPERASSAVYWLRLREITSDCALHVDGSVSCVGDDTGETPRFPGDYNDYLQIGGFVKDSMRCALRSNGEVWCATEWGAVPAVVATEVQQISVSALGQCGIGFDGRAKCWGGRFAAGIPDAAIGAERFAQLVANRSSFAFEGDLCRSSLNYREGDAPDEPEWQTNAVLNDVCGVTVDGRVVCLDTLWNTTYPPPEGERFVQITMYRRLICGLTFDRDVLCWGGEFDTFAEGQTSERFNYYGWGFSSRPAFKVLQPGKRIVQLGGADGLRCDERGGVVSCLTPGEFAKSVGAR